MGRWSRFGLAVLVVLLLLVLCAGCGEEVWDGNGEELRPVPASTQRTIGAAVLTIRVLDRVAQTGGGGDAILVADSAASPPRHVLIDAGEGPVAAAYVEAAGIRTLDLMILTHAHSDHFGGMEAVLDRARVRIFAFNGQARALAAYNRLLERVRVEVDTVLVVEAVRVVRFGEGEGATRLVLLPPVSRYLSRDTNDGRELNDGSLGVRVERGGFTFFGAGDAESMANAWFVERFPAYLDVAVLKLGHHGSADATQPFWLDATTPEVALISANGTTHPHGSVIRMVEARGIELFCTPEHGMITIRADSMGRYAVATSRDPRRRCRPGSQAY